ncbi:hypothetical protein GCM10027566_40860 [Arachidicoccus ginsenosidivorans]
MLLGFNYRFEKQTQTCLYFFPISVYDTAPNASDYIIDLTLQICGFNNTNSVSDNEKALVKALGLLKSGLTLLKQDSNGTFGQLSIDSNDSINVINCN